MPSRSSDGARVVSSPRGAGTVALVLAWILSCIQVLFSTRKTIPLTSISCRDDVKQGKRHRERYPEHGRPVKISISQDIPAINKPRLMPGDKDKGKYTWRTWKAEVEVLAHSLILGLDWKLGAKAAMFLLLYVFFLLTDDVCIVLGWLDRPLEVGWTRIRSEYVSCCKGRCSMVPH